jgi:hypothetical protein
VRIVRAIEFFNSLKPVDGAEAMLAEQMVGTHFAALDCLRRAALPNQTPTSFDIAMKNAQKLMALYARQLESLNKNRSKDQQKVTVEHVYVAAGGQAIVGSVDTSGRPSPREASGTAALEHAPRVSLGETPTPEPGKAQRGKF